MNNEDKLKAALKNDAALRDAIRQDEMEAPKMPADLNVRLMKRVAAEVPAASRTRRLWPWIAAACAIAFIAVFVTPPKSDTQGREMVAKVETTVEKPAVAEQPAVTAPAVTAPATAAPAIVAKAAPKAPKAEREAPKAATPAKPEAVEPAAELVLAAAATAQPAVAEEKVIVMSERDIPITRPENYKYTPEELAQLKKQAAEAYLKWVELEMEISRNNLQQTAQNKD